MGVILKHPFDSLSRAPGIKTPALFVIAEKDTVVKPEHSLRLALAWGGEKDVVIIEGKDHNDVTVDDYLERGMEFLGEE